MSSLLRFLGITDSKSYHAWLLVNHPDKLLNGGDGASLERVKEVNNEYTRVYKNSPAAPRPASTPTPTLPTASKQRAQWSWQSDNTCGARVQGLQSGCQLRLNPGCTTCFYHMPGTDHLKYAQNTARFSSMGRLKYPIHTIHHCTAKKATGGGYCFKIKKRGMQRCAMHCKMRSTHDKGPP